MGQQQSAPQAYRFVSSPIRYPPSKLTQIEHQSFLRLRTVPFKGSYPIANQLYLQRSSSSLTSLLIDRHNTTKLFTEQDIMRLLESVLYGLAYLEAANICYKDLTSDNIQFCVANKSFKLVPPSLVQESGLHLIASGRRFSLLSPQMIMAVRQRQESLPLQLLNKSNVFIMGMILLEACTLRPSCYCYDEDNFDILDRSVKERLSLVKQHYSHRLYNYLSLMLEYDYTVRVSAKQLAIMLNNDQAKSHFADDPISFDEVNIYIPESGRMNVSHQPYNYAAIRNAPTVTASREAYTPPPFGISQHYNNSRRLSPLARPPTYRPVSPLSRTNRVVVEDSGTGAAHSPFRHTQNMRSSYNPHINGRESLPSDRKKYENDRVVGTINSDRHMQTQINQNSQYRIDKIKEEIERSRRLMEDFRRKDQTQYLY